MEESYCVLLGAGFSAPMGYPTGEKLNNLLVKITGQEFSFHTSGTLAVSLDGNKPDWGYKTSYDIQFDFCRELIGYYSKKKGQFDYEEFYDFMHLNAKTDPEVEKLASPYLREYETTEQLLSSLDNIYAQVIAFYLKDKDGKSEYGDAGHMCGGIWPGYTGILNCFQKLWENNILNVFTLNHDLFFERLNISDWFKGQLCDGFQEIGSPYYGILKANGRSYMVRLEHYTGKYESRIRLHKLHGSLDYGVYYGSEGSRATPEKYLKTRYGVGFGDLLKEKKNQKGELEYEYCWINYHADFLTGTSSKIERYEEPLLYKHLFEKFRNDLREAKSLLIIGYGGKDSEINKMLLENFDYKKKSSFIVDPFPGTQLKELGKLLNSSFIDKHLEVVRYSDIGLNH